MKGRRLQKSINRGIEEVDRFHKDTRDAIFTVTDYLIELADWIEDYCRTWIKEFGKLVGDSLVTDIGFLKKQGKKLTTLQLIGILSSFLEINFNILRKLSCENM